ncbi:hypothetical protein E4T80_04270 [Muribacter muris]|uniref:Uncharacterized protein n=2 Tax=Muribacter muris TaxID=67855 RepID=A0A4Y9JZA3_9PAST|nr:hypothetical protein [Muribacter muris]MBF0827859.1 hypothetical protein [Muribacter muris]TFV11121.1 hypothetical protein E4T80_04270 [Muribacter muris]
MMATNRIPVSVRISQDDADFIAGLQLEGAHTPSEKIRELLTQARLAYTQPQNYQSALKQAEQFLQNAKHDVLQAEKRLGVHSHILARLFELLPDLTATLAVDLEDNITLDGLKQYEQEIMWRIVRLMDSILQLAVIGKGSAYDDKVLNQLENTLKLAHIITDTQQKQEAL